METFKGCPRRLSYPSPPDRAILAVVKKPSKDNLKSNDLENSVNPPPKIDYKKKLSE